MLSLHLDPTYPEWPFIVLVLRGLFVIIILISLDIEYKISIIESVLKFWLHYPSAQQQYWITVV